jgi:mono/diheme cytochrome c family protein
MKPTLLTALAVLLLAPSVHRAEAIEVWVRAAGQHAAAAPPARSGVRSMVLDKGGVPLTRLLASYPAPDGSDLALLHFDNGMAIPYPFRNTAAVERLGIRVSANRRLVVKSQWHPMLPAARSTFSPWAHADRLRGIELVEGAAYWRQFAAHQDRPTGAGERVFIARCQYCHGVREVGAKFGWDYLEPVPLHTYRSPRNLLLHVRYREWDAAERGFKMPALPDLSEADAKAIWTWMAEMAEAAPLPYAPGP